MFYNVYEFTVKSGTSYYILLLLCQQLFTIKKM